MTTCLLHSESGCLNRVARARTFVDRSLPGLLDRVYDAIAAKGRNARVVVVGYPHFYQVPGNCVIGLSAASRRAWTSRPSREWNRPGCDREAGNRA